MTTKALLVSYFLAYAKVDTVTDDGDYNHLFSFRDMQGRNLLLSWTGPERLGMEDERVWIHIHGMECKKTDTVDDVNTDSGSYSVPAIIYLCDAKLVRKDVP